MEARQTKKQETDKRKWKKIIDTIPMQGLNQFHTSKIEY